VASEILKGIIIYNKMCEYFGKNSKKGDSPDINNNYIHKVERCTRSIASKKERPLSSPKYALMIDSEQVP
jgi:hypothetical protein